MDNNYTYNPFKENRAEQMKELLNYYVPIPGLESLNKPVVIEGGRGSGKTMFFLCNSWREIYIQIRKEGKTVSDLYNDKPFVGIYYRVDTAFVSAMNGKDRDNWNIIFETYLSICLLKELLGFLDKISGEPGISKIELTDLVKRVSEKFNDEEHIDSISCLLEKLEKYLDEIEDIINAVKSDVSFRYIKTNRFIMEVCGLINNVLKKEVIFKIFIDEYETLQEYQQKIINTLIKHSSLPVIYNIGLRPKGMKTNSTISETETIESPHDYEDFQLTIDEKEYVNIIKEICCKRIQYGKEIGKIPQEASEDIQYYLGVYDMDFEINQIVNSKRKPKYLTELEDIIKENGKMENFTAEEIESAIEVLCKEAKPINSRLHYLLLKHKTPYSPTLKILLEEYVQKSSRYKEWEHNRKFGIVFMLAKDYSKPKMYYGLDVYVALSSGIVRYFLELCEQAFRMELLDGFSWDRDISPSHQSQAAKYVSEYKIADINGYEPVGKELRIFVQYLGQIFNQLHVGKKVTLGEPEPNHFSTNDLALNTSIESMLSFGIMWNVLQPGAPTKKKQAAFAVETVDYYLNRIYAPYFEISYRDMRKITLPIDVLTKLFSGDVDEAKRAARKFLKEDDDTECTQLSLF